MAKRQSKGKESRVNRETVNFGFTVATVSIVFVFLGYLMGQYAVEMVRSQSGRQAQITQTDTLTEKLDSQLDRLANSGEGTASQTATPSLAPSPSTSQVATDTSRDSSPNNVSLYRVQVGAFSQKANAETVKGKLEELGYEAIITSGPPFRVQTGAFSSRNNAQRLGEELKGKGFEVAIVN